ncbi:hypothetical protein AB1Y20_012384 [Prymnesium parvum]|uniref:PUA domain-containing protein n=1 Tax=Prymnesium parvum TaxID=97485 RepID=A0AB34IRP2_PRYPA
MRWLRSRQLALLCSLAGTSAAVGVVRVIGNKARLFKAGQPLVYAGAVHTVQQPPAAGGVVDVTDGAGEPIGWGVWNGASLYRVRLLALAHEGLEHRCVATLLRARLREAAQRREACGLPSERTSAFRLVNGEGDRLSGLTVDLFGRVAVAVSSALWLELRREAVEAALLALPDVDAVVWRRSEARLKQDGWQEEVVEEADGKGDVKGDVKGEVEVKENGLSFLVAPVLGQKSGFYCDQRDNRAMFAEFCEGKRMLDLFCYSGGFSLAAARAGASACVGVDSSEFAISAALGNAQLNGLSHSCEFTKSDVIAFLKETEEGSFDLVVCDPPKLAPSVKDLTRATRKYKQINGLAMRALKKGGLMLSCTCSAAMTQSGTFVKMLHEAATAQGRTITVLKTTGAAADHVVHPCCPENNYLTAVLIHVG